MSRKLWTVLADHQLVAVIAAEARETANRIAVALAEHHDLPSLAGSTRMVKAGAQERRKILSQARELGCDQSFLACVRGGMFLTHIESLDPACPLDQAEIRRVFRCAGHREAPRWPD